jgi:hypothetical protein
MLRNDTLPHTPPPTLALQSHGVEFADMTFGTPLRRVSAATLGITNTARGLHTEYPQLSAFNADDSLLLCTTGGGIRGGGNIVARDNPTQILHVLEFTSGLSSAHEGSSVRWDPVIPTRLWFYQDVNVGGATLTGNTTAGSPTITSCVSTIGFNPGDTVYVLGAGPLNSQGNDGMWKSTVVSTTGSTITLNSNATVSKTGTRYNRTARLCRYDLNTSVVPYTRTITTVYDFTEYFRVENSGGSTNWTGGNSNSAPSASWEEMSDDGSWMAGVGTIDGTKLGYGYISNSSAGSSGTSFAPRNHEVFALNVKTGIKKVINVVQSPAALPPSLGGTLGAAYEPYGTNDAVDSIDWCAMSPSGNYVIVQNNTNIWLGGLWSQAGGSNAYSTSTGAYAGKLSGRLGHGDLFQDAAGTEWLIQDQSGGTDSMAGDYISMVKIPQGVTWFVGQEFTSLGVDKTNTFANGQVIRILKHKYANIHVSARNTGLKSYVLVECYGTNFSNVGFDPDFRDEAVIVYLDSRWGNPNVIDSLHFERLCHFRCSRTAGVGEADGYYREAHPAISHNGEYVAFTSDWGNNAVPTDVYIADLAWFKHFPSTKTWRRAPKITNYANRYNDHNGWTALAGALGFTRDQDGIYLEGATCGVDGKVAVTGGHGIPYGNDLWRFDPNLWRWINVIPTDPNPWNSNIGQTSDVIKQTRRVQTATTNSTNVTFSFGSNAGDVPNNGQGIDWVAGTTLINVWDYKFTTQKYSNLGLASVSSTSCVFTSSVTLAVNDILISTALPQNNQFPPWYSFAKPWIGHPYCSVKSMGDSILVGSKNSGQPTVYWNHIWKYSLNSGYSLVDFGVTVTGGFSFPGMGLGTYNNQDAWQAAPTAYISTTNQVFKYNNQGSPAGSQSATGSIGIFDIATKIWSFYAPTPNPGRREGSACVYDSLRNRVWLFGQGDENSPGVWANAKNDVWYFDCSTHIWAQATTTGTSPSPRGQCSTEYDPVSDTWLIAYGRAGDQQNGSTAANPYYNDAYVLHLDTLAWERLPDVPVLASPINGSTAGFGASLGCYLPQPYNCYAVIDYQRDRGPTPGGGVNGDASDDPTFLFLRMVETGSPPPPPPPPPPPVFSGTPIIPRNFM